MPVNVLLLLSLSVALSADPQCQKGIKLKSVCCAKSCGVCGGSGCGAHPGGSSACCGGNIEHADQSCDTHDPPCMINPSSPTPAPPASAMVSFSHSSVFSVEPEYVSFNLDASSHDIQTLTDPTLDALAAALAPAHLRVGGTQQDYNIYTVSGSNVSCASIHKPMTSYVQRQEPPTAPTARPLHTHFSFCRYRCRDVTEGIFTGLLAFTQRNNLTLVYGLSDMFGRPTKTKPEQKLCDGSGGCPARDQSNLAALLAWTATHAPGAPIHGWELGNELNACLDGTAGAEAQAADFAALKRKVADTFKDKAQKMIGPDTHSSAEYSSEGRAWFDAFVRSCKAAGNTVDAYTFHMYSMGNGPSIDPKNLDQTFLSAAALNKAGLGGQALAAIVEKHHGGEPSSTRPQLWAGETASANDGGQSGVTDTYIDGFWYLDQLGSLAAANVSVFQRQVLLSSGGYPMVEGALARSGSVNSSASGSGGVVAALTPLPDYYIALLHKRVMGQKVLRASSTSAGIRAYCHCAAAFAEGAQPGAVAVALLNIGSAPVTVSLGQSSGSDTSQSLPRVEYILTAGEKGSSDWPNPLQSKQTLLNGELLELHGSTLPALVGHAAAAGTPFVMPPTSYGFVVLPTAKAAACM
jgi:heparanase 1